MNDTKAIAIAASGAKRPIQQLREANDYLLDRGLSAAHFIDRDDDGNYSSLTDLDFAAIDGSAEEALGRFAQEARDAEIAEEERLARAEFEASGPDTIADAQGAGDNAAVDGDQSKAPPAV